MTQVSGRSKLSMIRHLVALGAAGFLLAACGDGPTSPKSDALLHYEESRANFPRVTGPKPAEHPNAWDRLDLSDLWNDMVFDGYDCGGIGHDPEPWCDGRWGAQADGITERRTSPLLGSIPAFRIEGAENVNPDDGGTGATNTARGWIASTIRDLTGQPNEPTTFRTVTVRFLPVARIGGASVCGSFDPGASLIEVSTDPEVTRGCPEKHWGTLSHEVGHALGFYHVGGSNYHVHLLTGRGNGGAGYPHVDEIPVARAAFSYGGNRPYVDCPRGHTDRCK